MHIKLPIFIYRRQQKFAGGSHPSAKENSRHLSARVDKDVFAVFRHAPKTMYSTAWNVMRTIVRDENGTRWVRTGDLGYIDKDGFVFVTGRLKRIYSTRAEKNGTLYKFFPDHVTNIISQVDGVDECAVVCIPDDEYKNIGIAYVVINDASKETMICDEIMKHCSNNLPPSMIYRLTAI